jgi:hypothetical protein
LLSAGSTLTYIGPAFALFGYAIKQWSTCQQVPQEAVDLLQSCRDLLFDLNQAWPHISLQQWPELLQHQLSRLSPQLQRLNVAELKAELQEERLQRWLRLVAGAAAECVCINSKGPVIR